MVNSGYEIGCGFFSVESKGGKEEEEDKD